MEQNGSKSFFVINTVKRNRTKADLFFSENKKRKKLEMSLLNYKNFQSDNLTVETKEKRTTTC